MCLQSRYRNDRIIHSRRSLGIRGRLDTCLYRTEALAPSDNLLPDPMLNTLDREQTT